MTVDVDPTETVLRAALTAIAAVDDPEMPGVSIVELGIVASASVDDTGHARVELLPTFSGCPALSVIASRVRDAVLAVDGVSSVEAGFVHSPQWSVARVTPTGERALAQLGVAVMRDGVAECPRCGSQTVERSMFGPTRCRAVHSCTSCGEVVEVLR